MFIQGQKFGLGARVCVPTLSPIGTKFSRCDASDIYFVCIKEMDFKQDSAWLLLH
jgi:hypothetical protein